MWLYWGMTSAGIRALKDNLSHYVRRIEAGERIAVTAHGRVVAELGPPTGGRVGGQPSRYDELVTIGVVRLPIEAGDPLADWPNLRLAAGTVSELINADRDEA